MTLGVTDVWSQIRKNSSSKMSSVIDSMPEASVYRLFAEFLRICEDPNATWQETEGAILGMCVIIRKFHWDADSSTTAESPSSHQSVLKVLF